MTDAREVVSSSIAVVGGGPATVCLLDALANGPHPVVPRELTVFEESPALWRGRPYREDLACIRVNAPPYDMSIRHGDAVHLQRWLDSHLEGGTASAHFRDVHSGSVFVSRGLYGSYLAECAENALQRLRYAGWGITVVQARVISACPAAGGFRLRTADGGESFAGQLVLCLGAGDPIDLYGLSGLPGYIQDPYLASTSISPIDPEIDVAVLGTGLTAMDVVMALATSGHRGRIHLLSRGGVLPAVRQATIPYTLKYFTPMGVTELARRCGTLSLRVLIALLARELASVGERIDPLANEISAIAVESARDRLVRQLDTVRDPRMALRILQRAVPDTGPDIWPRLPENERVLILQQHYRSLMSLCCPMPPATAAILLRLMDAGQLAVHSGLRAVKPSRRGFVVSTRRAVHRSGVVVNAINAPSRKVGRQGDPLVRSLVHTAGAACHPGGGLAVHRYTGIVATPGSVGRLYALGDLTAGSLFFTFGIPSLVDRAVEIARTLLASDCYCTPTAAGYLEHIKETQ